VKVIVSSICPLPSFESSRAPARAALMAALDAYYFWNARLKGAESSLATALLSHCDMVQLVPS
jgi:hypothetical protein